MPRESTLGGRDGTTIDVRKRSSNYFGVMGTSLVIAGRKTRSSRGSIAQHYPKVVTRLASLFRAARAALVTVPRQAASSFSVRLKDDLEET